MKKQLALITLLILALPACAQTDTTVIHKFLNDWHIAAAKADAKAYFGAIADDGIYIATDAAERWTKPQFIDFAKQYFAREKAWDFKPYDREIHVSNDGRFVWFSELLTTWMGVCRGSGLLQNTPQGWKIQQYHLAMTVHNDLVRDFITLVDNFEKSRK